MTDERESNLSEIPTGSAMTDEARESGLRKVATDLAMDVWQAASATYSRRIAELEAQVATARDDGIEAAAKMCDGQASWNGHPACTPNLVRALKSQPREAI